MIDLHRVHKAVIRQRVGRQELLVDVSIAIPHDKRVAVLGRDRAATSMLLHLLAGSELPDRGLVVTDGLRFSPIINAGGIAGASMVASLSVLRNVKFFADVHGVDYHALVHVVDSMCELGPHLKTKVRALDWPMRRALEVSLIAALPFHCYLIDQIQSLERRLIWQLYRAAEMRGAGVVFTTSAVDTAVLLGETGIASLNGAMRSFWTVREAIDAHEGAPA